MHHSFQNLVTLDGRTDRRTDGLTDRLTETDRDGNILYEDRTKTPARQTGKWTDGRTDGRTERQIDMELDSKNCDSKAS